MTLLDDPPRSAPTGAVDGLDAGWMWLRSFDPSAATIPELDHAARVLAELRSFTDSIGVRVGVCRSRLVAASTPSPPTGGGGSTPQPKPKPQPPQPGGGSRAEALRRRDAQVGADLAPSFADALARGDVSVDHLAALGRVRNAADVAAAERSLLAAAVVRNADEFAQYLKNWDIERDEARGLDIAAQRRARRGLKFFTGELSMGGTTVVLEPAAQLQVKDAIMRVADRLWRNGDRTSSATQRYADAFCLLVTGRAPDDPPDTTPSSTTPSATTPSTTAPGSTTPSTAAPAKPAVATTPTARPTMVVFVDEGTLFGRLEGAGFATTVDGIRLTATEARRLAVEADLLPAVLGGAGQVLDLGRRSRDPNDAQFLALLATFGGCVIDGCTCPPLWTHAHHALEWEHGGPTDLANLWPYCRAHHTMHHANGWQGRIADGQVRLTDAQGRRIPTRNRLGPTGFG